MASTTVIEPVADHVHPSAVHLDEGKLFAQLGENGGGDGARWILDSGATNHMMGVRTVFSEIDLRVHGTVRFGDGSVTNIEGRGTILIKCKTVGHKALTGVYYIPRLNATIVSLGQMEEAGYKIVLESGFLKLWNRVGTLAAKVKHGASRLYVLHLDVDRPVCLAAQGTSPTWRWHSRYGHLNFHGLKRSFEGELVKGPPHIDHVDQVCDSCLIGKQRRATFPTVAKFRAVEKMELVHENLCGPVTPVTPGGKRYFFLLVDDVSRYMWLMLLAMKDEALAAFTAFQARAEAEAGRKIGTLRTDCGGEFTARSFADHCTKQGMQRHLTAPYTPEQNGVMKRRNQSIMGMTRSMMKAMSMPSWFWGEAVLTFVFILNMSPTQSIEGRTPYEVWHDKKPSVDYFRIFGCVAHTKQGNKRLSKLEDRSTMMVFIGYEPSSKAWRFYNPVTRRVHVSCDAVFEEDHAWSWNEDEIGDDEPFRVEYIAAGGAHPAAGDNAWPDSPLVTPEQNSPARSSPGSVAMPRAGLSRTHLPFRRRRSGRARYTAD
jgi:transposase InsO family protein